MRIRGAVVSVLLVFTSIFSAPGFSPIGNVDGWSPEQLGKAGITVRPWKHDLQTEDPPLEWIQVTFDCSQLPKEQDVLMTACIRSREKTVSLFRAERGKPAPDKAALVFSVKEDYVETSYVEVFIWKKTGDGYEAIGYHLSVKRIMELTRK